MEEDLLANLTRQVKEEVVENYFRERRLIELQIEHLFRKAEQARSISLGAGERLVRLSHLMIAPEMREKLREILGPPPDNFWDLRLSNEFKNRLRLIRAFALTRRAKFRKLIVRSYSNLSEWAKKYRSVYEDLCQELAAVNANIEAFQNNFDLLAIMNLLRNLDIRSMERQNILGGNYTASELAELDQGLFIHKVPLEKLVVPQPFDIPEIGQVEEQLGTLAEHIFRGYEREARLLMR